jgi:membrane fusion protein, multidrug efflux system
VPVKITIDRGQEAAAALSVGLSVEAEVMVGRGEAMQAEGAQTK